jgi:hypothetical protein
MGQFSRWFVQTIHILGGFAEALSRESLDRPSLHAIWLIEVSLPRIRPIAHNPKIATAPSQFHVLSALQDAHTDPGHEQIHDRAGATAPVRREILGKVEP